MTIRGIRDGLANAVRAAEISVGGEVLTAYPYTPDSVTVPCFYVGEVEIDPNIDYGGDSDSNTYVCRVLTSENDDAAGQAALDALLERSGSTSVRAVIMAAAGSPGGFALGGACDDLKIVSVSAYRRFIVGMTTYFGAEIRVFTIGAGSE